ncbi:MAG: HesA/MoeB/ThiF family protein [Nitrososphaerota archaeon]|jgi:adenylyltransferase/sulfurtransferase|nr:HesA/MoeB/ThiF family protein [Nitrososphaerota archaeon]MDG6930271.1 HesA/MoeB/ThiF family protein [Nitrososphaerota archaeon]MDG6932984.1 HesA/MoeB/ThiF family protein [Nitrososphaerota archaeon]MDG6935716.1 HesA/MoeB/ThiF family protein [Nitrososphaerota archaeon]MDG6943396.1 HesA/MoeB/ThiF family protein [Nitrososphaerota archaeon]
MPIFAPDTVESVAWSERYSRQIVLDYIGPEGQERLGRSTALVAGVGGLGSFSAMELARMGVGNLILVDRDVVSYSDLHRQVLYDERDVGLPKVEAARRKLSTINSEARIEVYGSSVNNVELMDRLVKKSDVIVDGMDNMAGRYTINSLSVRNGRPYVFAAAIGLYGNVSTIIPGKTPCLEEFYGGLDDSGLPKCATSGVHPSIVYMTASICAHEAVNLLVGKTPGLASKLALIDLRSLSLQYVDLKKSDSCPVCSGAAFRPREEEVELSCSKDGMATLFVNRPINLDIAVSVRNLKDGGFSIIDEGAYYVTFGKGSTRGTIFDTGYMVFQSGRYYRGVEDEALKAYEASAGK